MLLRTFSSRCRVLRKQSRRGSIKRWYGKETQTPEEIADLGDESRISDMLKNAANFKESSTTNGAAEWSTTPYPRDAPSCPPNEEEANEKPKLDPLDTSILMFPGQGTLKVGTLRRYMKFPRVQEMCANANEALGYDLAKLCLEGPQERLNRTEFNQPATVLTSLAALERLWEERPRAVEECKAVAGYSVGEITALIFSGALGIDDGIQLAGVRGTAMQAASDETPQGMLFGFCSASAKVPKICQGAVEWATNLGIENPVCRIAVFLYTQGKIFAGHEETLRYIEENSRSLNLRMLRRIPVSGAFHTSLMEPAVKPFVHALKAISFEAPRVSVYSNVNGRPYRTTNDIRRLLTKQIVSPVRWEQILHTIYERPADTPFPRTFDLGSDGTMHSILKKVNAKASDYCYEL